MIWPPEYEHVEVGQVWYAWGHHYKVEERTTRDGDPGVGLQNVKVPRDHCVVRVHALLKHGTRSDS